MTRSAPQTLLVRIASWAICVGIRCKSPKMGRRPRTGRPGHAGRPQLDLERARAHAVQRAPGAVRAPRVAGAPAVAEQVEVELELLAGRRDREHRVVELLERRLGRNRPSRVPTRETCVSTGTSRIPSANSSTQAAVLRPTPGSEVRYRCASGTGWPASQSSERWSGSSGRPGGGAPAGRGASPIARRIDLIRADLTFEIPPGRIASSISSTGASRTASQVGKRSRSAEVGDVAVAVVGRLREHGQDQLGDRMAVGLRQRDPVDEAEAIADRADAAGDGRRQPPAHSSAPHRSHARGRTPRPPRRSADGDRRRVEAGEREPREQHPGQRVAGADRADRRRRERRARRRAARRAGSRRPARA